ncbi:major strawberry allergen Fra a 1-3-like [Rhodamnia argentea]|uniref:Major strawberry allergen Fra a 1-3-like n=1 Tax=Rhodamnia argentea TaxID=178133 RepID=A0ABM3GYA4_9MYRT|nr:major strawberry allergen Fra a 1-3-like [Rhodamnia argentea]
MGVVPYSQEFTSAVAPSRMFKALVLDSHNILPKIVPEGIKSVKFVEGDGGVGSIKQTNFGESAHIRYRMHKIGALDVENLYCKYTLIESDIKFDKIDCIVDEVKFTSANGGCVCKMTSDYHVKEGAKLKAELKEVDMKPGKDIAMGLLKSFKEYLLANPDICA